MIIEGSPCVGSPRYVISKCIDLFSFIITQYSNNQIFQISMKKILLSLAVLALGVSYASAETALFYVGSEPSGSNANYQTAITNNQSGNVVEGTTYTAGDITISFTQNNSNASNVNGAQVRWYQGDVLNITPSNGMYITNIEMTVVTSNNTAFTTTTGEVKGGKNSDTPTTIYWSGSVNTTLELTAGTQIRFSSMVVTYSTEPSTGGGTVTPDPDPDPTPSPSIPDNAVYSLFYIGSEPDGISYTYALELTGTVAGEGKSYEAGSVSITFSATSGNASQVNSGLLRWYKNEIMQVTPSNGATIYSVEVGGATNNSYNSPFTSKIGNVTGPTDGKITWSGSTTDPLSLTASGSQIRCSYILIAYVPGKPVAVDQPKISFDNSTNTVTITCETANANIYYTLDGTEPTNQSTKYEKPFTITKNVTVKAIAQLNNDYSYVASAECEYYGIYPNFASYIAANPTNGGKVEGPITAIYQNGQNLYTKDKDGGFMLVYGSTSTEFKNGDQISYISGNYKPYNGLPEMAAPVFGEVTSGTPVEPTTITLKDVETAILNSYIVINNVSIYEGSNARTFTLKDAQGNEVTLYNTFNQTLESIPTTGTFTITGFVGCYNADRQITPISIVKTSDENVGNDNTDDDNQGGSQDGKSATFNFADPSTLSATPALDLTITDDVTKNGIDLTGYTLTDEDVTLAFAATEDASTMPRLWYTASSQKWTFRLYQYNSISVSVEDGYVITGIEFAGTNIKTTEPTFTPAGIVEGKTWTADKNALSQEVVIYFAEKPASTPQVTSMTVYYEEGIPSAVSTIDINENAPVEFFNLQGQRVNNPSNGIFIVRQGNKTSKVYIR